MKHELVQLAGKLDWDWLDGEIAPPYSDTPDQPLIPSPIDQNRWAHWRNPMDMIRQG